MAVYTRVSETRLQDFLRHYELGELIAFSGIADGIENTNYRLQTRRGNFILTLYEDLPEADIQAVFALLAHLQTQGLLVPFALKNRHGRRLNSLCGKNAAVFPCLPGRSISSPCYQHCYAVGRQLARLHLVGQNAPMQRENPKNLMGLKTLFQQLKPGLRQEDACKIEAELDYQQSFDQVDLPSGVIHADLFRDNVLFTGDELSGIIDFYSSCRGLWLYDIAVTINDWCKDNAFRICNRRKFALLDGYRSIRVLEETELAMLPVMLRRAALRFWLSRLSHIRDGQQGIVGAQKDPREYRSIFHRHISASTEIS